MTKQFLLLVSSLLLVIMRLCFALMQLLSRGEPGAGSEHPHCATRFILPV